MKIKSKKKKDSKDSGSKSITDMVMDYEDTADAESGDPEEATEDAKGGKKMAKESKPTPSKDSKAFMKGRYKSILKKK